MGTVKGVIVGISFVTNTVTVSLSLEMRLKAKGKRSKDHSNGFNKKYLILKTQYQLDHTFCVVCLVNNKYG